MIDVLSLLCIHSRQLWNRCWYSTLYILPKLAVIIAYGKVSTCCSVLHHQSKYIRRQSLLSIWCSLCEFYQINQGRNHWLDKHGTWTKSWSIKKECMQFKYFHAIRRLAPISSTITYNRPITYWQSAQTIDSCLCLYCLFYIVQETNYSNSYLYGKFVYIASTLDFKQ